MRFRTRLALWIAPWLNEPITVQIDGNREVQIQRYRAARENFREKVEAWVATAEVGNPWYCSCGWTGFDHQAHMDTTGHAVRNFALSATEEGQP
jgi:hypothetical protein